MDHDAHVRAYHRHLIGKAVYQAMTVFVASRVYGGREIYRREMKLTGSGRPIKRWTWKNHVANWINKTVKLLERFGL